MVRAIIVILALLVGTVAQAQWAPCRQGGQCSVSILNGQTLNVSGTYTCSAGSGSNCFVMSTQGSRFKYGSGASDYFTFDGTYMEIVGNLKIDGTVTNNGQASWFLPAGVTANSGAVGAAGPNTNVGGSLYVDTTNVGNVGSGEDDLISRTMAANVLRATGRRVVITATGTTANNANAKTLKVYFGGTAIATLSLPTGIAGHWRARAQVVRTGSSTQKYEVSIEVLDSADGSRDAGATAIGTLAVTESGTIVVKTTGEGVANDDIVAQMQTIDFL